MLVADPGAYGLSWQLSRHAPSDRTDRWLANDPPTIRVQDVASSRRARLGESR